MRIMTIDLQSEKSTSVGEKQFFDFSLKTFLTIWIMTKVLKVYTSFNQKKSLITLTTNCFLTCARYKLKLVLRIAIRQTLNCKVF